MCLVAVFAGLVSRPALAAEDMVLKWSDIAARTAAVSTNPFNGARVVAITQLAVFEAVNAITARLRAVSQSRDDGPWGRVG